ncbi:V-type ATP synthase subunit F [Deinococcus radiodurans]|jgi:Archaeal/vacuolar-type H+-ATPase subunit F|uniref:V-type ATP synthase, F subunit n=1 Tax=Deinococcus radiodurans (strain ATCC 13939 / DSM 20539 / JCM 16871 / CCUG 27074 / LMG 4051 / NBRC 15346 / NCIMB 9279 / VKM B-1422 / R1) TaxID=243230 RepID=Q9RWG9_DEIRA|nr:V-type ATP synthase subunit F [Deinococcus radiodurans]AAF10277.1 v-type ATP synthase, F subunit [Deinococcus radiodurans R1 = ATCC 13939 = DSM 20539]ANC72075.1 V-type ATP synthase subunit F [Deinococcus radiodurans R1 = ATCC 13939 = DSM 20539]QEM72639.1 V-type ATP synthase subunit F [Deinococcus radiodurans]QIP28854.1 V-type ATP synthase subunit F [Deinococcus radiodurans]QIP32440.1 V-type ATP synthase subunit F [Deinococcus radiodurans]
MTKGESTMQRIAVLSDAETATGYRLAGATVIEASPEDALRTLEQAITDGGYGLIAVDTGLIPDPATATARIMRGRDLPILLPIPSLRDAFSSDTVDAKAYMGKLVRDTIGFDIKL